MLSDIVGKNLAAHASKHLYGRAKTHFSTLVPNCSPENVEIGMKEEARIKALAVPSRPVGETFDFEESTIESEVSSIRQHLILHLHAIVHLPNKLSIAH